MTTLIMIPVRVLLLVALALVGTILYALVFALLAIGAVGAAIRKMFAALMS